MDSRNTVMLGLGVAIVLVISAGAAYGMMGQTAHQQSTYSSSVSGASGYEGGMMGGRSISSAAPPQGANAGSVTGAPGYLGGMMGGYGGAVYPGGVMGGGYGGIMGSFGGMMTQFAQSMGNYWNHAQ